MRIGTTIRLALAAFLFLAVGARAAEETPAPPPLAKHLTAQVAIKAPEEFLESLDSYVAASTENTSSAIPPGFLGMMLQMYLPIPMDAWQGGKEMYLLFPKEMPGGRGMTAVFSAESFDSFVAAAEKKGLTSEKIEPAAKFAKAVKLEFPNGGGFEVVDLGGGKLALATDQKAITLALGGANAEWRPEMGVNAAATVAFTVGNDADIRAALDKAVDELKTKQAEILAKVEGTAINPAVVKGLLAMAEKYLPKIKDEFVKIGSLSVDMDFADDNLSLAFRGDFAADSFLGGIGAAMSKVGNVDNDIAKKVGPDVISMTSSVSALNVMPNARRDIGSFMADLGEMVFPKLKDRLVKMVDESLTYTADGMVMANYPKQNAYYTASWVKTKDTAALLAACAESFAIFNDMIAAAITDPAYGVRLEKTAGKTADGIEFQRYQPVFNDVAALDKLFADLSKADPAAEQMWKTYKSFVFYTGAKGDVVVVIGGLAEDADFAAAVKTLDGGGKSLLDVPAVAEVADALKYRQGSLAILDIDKTIVMIAREMGKSLDAAQRAHDETADGLYNRAIEKGIPELDETGAATGFAFGARYGQPYLQWAMPAKAVNALVLAYQVFSGAVREEMGPADGDDEDDQGDDGDDSDDGDEPDADEAAPEGQPNPS